MVKGFVECTQFNVSSTTQIDNLFKSLPQYVIISGIILVFIIVLAIIVLFFGLLKLLFYSVRRKYDSLDKHTEKKYPNNNDDNNDKDPPTYKDDKEELQKDSLELGVGTMPGKQKIIDLVDKAIELKKKE